MKKFLTSLKGLKKQASAVIALFAGVITVILLCKFTVVMWNLIM